jgi:type III secretion protein U
MSEKTEAPSEKRLREARKQGNIASSKMLASACSQTFAFAAVCATLPVTGADLLAYLRLSLTDAALGQLTPTAGLLRAASALWSASIPVLAAGFFGAVLGSALQSGLSVNPSAISLKLEKLSPGSGLKRLFSKKNLIEAARSAVVVFALLWLLWTTARDAAQVVAALPRLEAFLALGTGWGLVEGLLRRSLLLTLALGGADFLYQRHARWKGLMMSREELKREHKESDGDPHNKSKRKALHRALLGGTTARNVKQATVVVVNPTHVAVALRYDPKEAAAPTLVAKGIEEEAAKIRALAQRHKIPMIKDIPLARTLVRYDLGEEVPEELYQAIAVVLQKVHELGALPAVSLPEPPRSHS